MDASAEHDPERLLAHADWLRGLALRLAGDAHAAEDLAQETWLAALRAPLGEVRSLRAYLAGILRNQGQLRRRAELRRGAREQGAARAEAVPGADVALERAELARALVTCVLALEEPFRSAVLLRYGEGLSAQAAAARLGIPVKTVESRARRGLARLRERWTRAHGPAQDAGRAWGAALALLSGAPSPSLALSLEPPAAGAAQAAAAGSLGVLLMQTKLALIALALAGGAGALWWWNAHDGDALRPVPVVSAARAGETALEPGRAALAPAASAGAATARTSVAAPEAAAPAEDAAPLPASPRLLRGRVFDVEAHPLAGVAVRFGWGGGAQPVSAQQTALSGPDGAFELDAASSSSMDEVCPVDPALATLIASRVPDRGGPELVLVVARYRSLAGRVVDERGAPVAGARVNLELPPGFLARFEVILDGTVTHLDGAVADEEGRFALDHAPVVPGSQLGAALEGFAPGACAAPDGPAEGLELVLRRPALELDVLSGRVVDEHGQAAGGAWVTLGERCAVADEAGSFRLEREGADNAREISALLRGHRPGHFRPEADPATGAPLWPAWLEIRLAGPPLALAGRVVDELGEPRTGVSLWVDDPTPFGVIGDDMGGLVEFLLAQDAGPETDPGDAYWCSTSVDEAGRFELAGLLERDYTLRLFDGQRLETATAGPFTAGETEVVVVFPRVPPATLAGRVVSRAGTPLAGVAVGVMGAKYGGIWESRGGTTTDAEGRFSLTGVGNAALLVSLSGEGIAPAWLGVALGEELELVAVALHHAKVELDDPARADAFRVVDAEGADVELYAIGVGGFTRLHSAELVDGRSRTLGVPENAAELVLERDGVEVDRMPLALEPGRLNVLRP